MAKETKAERAVREELEAEASYQDFVRKYPTRFAALLFDAAVKHNDVLIVARLDAETYRFARENETWSDVVLKTTAPANRDWEALYNLEAAEQLVKNRETELDEENRKYHARQTAFAKLSKEERELLGV
jgi:hypothetical protein